MCEDPPPDMLHHPRGGSSPLPDMQHHLRGGGLAKNDFAGKTPPGYIQYTIIVFRKNIPEFLLRKPGYYPVFLRFRI